MIPPCCHQWISLPWGRTYFQFSREYYSCHKASTFGHEKNIYFRVSSCELQNTHVDSSGLRAYFFWANFLCWHAILKDSLHIRNNFWRNFKMPQNKIYIHLWTFIYHIIKSHISWFHRELLWVVNLSSSFVQFLSIYLNIFKFIIQLWHHIILIHKPSPLLKLLITIFLFIPKTSICS